MKNIALTFFSFTLILVWSGHASACWCRRDVLDTDAKVNRDIRQWLHLSSVVFTGEVIDKTTTGLKFRVRTWWKGKESAELTLRSQNYVLQTSEKEVEHFISDCAFNFDVGQTYLVYAQMIQGQLEVSKCSRTQFLNGAAHDVAELERLTKRGNVRRKSAMLRFLPQRNPTSAWSGLAMSGFFVGCMGKPLKRSVG